MKALELIFYLIVQITYGIDLFVKLHRHENTTLNFLVVMVMLVLIKITVNE